MLLVSTNRERQPYPVVPNGLACVASALDACARVTGTAFELPSGALHDAASMAGRMPAAMIFSASSGGVSHAREEDTEEDDLRAAIEAFGSFVNARLS